MQIQLLSICCAMTSADDADPGDESNFFCLAPGTAKGAEVLAVVVRFSSGPCDGCVKPWIRAQTSVAVSAVVHRDSPGLAFHPPMSESFLFRPPPSEILGNQPHQLSVAIGTLKKTGQPQQPCLALIA